MSVEMEREGVLLHLLGDDDTGTDSALWHQADVHRALTLCGLDVGYGDPRKPWAETPENRRYQMCAGEFTDRRPSRG